MHSRFSLLSLASALCLTTSLLYAQSGTATLTGTVVDHTGAVLAGVKVVVRDPETGFERETITNVSGNYNLPGLRPASYEITAELSGFRKRSHRGFVVEVNQTARLDIQLEVGEVTSVVEVHGAAALVRTENSILAMKSPFSDDAVPISSSN